MKKSLIQVLISFISVFLLFSCSLIGKNNSKSNGFSKEVNQGTNNTVITFFSDKTSDSNKAFTYNFPSLTPEQKETFEVSVKKNSGYMYAEYGITFGSSSSGYYAFVIDTKSKYSVFSYINGEINTISAKTTSNYLNTGYEAINKLKIVKSTNSYELYINNTKIMTVPVTGVTTEEYGAFVYVASSHNENFKNNPVEVIYEY